MKLFLKKHSQFFGLIIAGVLLYLAFQNTDFKDIWSRLKSIRIGYLFMALLAMFLLYVLKGIRWRAILKPIRKVSFTRVFSSLMIGYFAHNILPFRMGEFMRVYYLRKKESFSYSSLVGSVFAEKFFDGLSLILIALLLLIFSSDLEHSSFLPMVKIVLYLLGAATILYFLIHKLPRKATRFLRTWIYALFKGKGYRKLISSFRKFFHGFHSLHSLRRLGTAMFYSILVWLADVLSIYLLLLSFWVQLPEILLSSFLPLLIINLSVMIPTGPGDIGMFHLAGQRAFHSVLGLEANLALSITLILHFLTILPGFVLGGYFIVREHVKIELKEIKK